MSTPIRLNKALADAGLCSRRKADDLIAAGRVSVDGAPAQPGQKVDPAGQDIRVDGEPLAAPPATSVVLLCHKPVETLSTVKDPQGRPTVMDLVPPAHRGRRLYPVGRLDYYSEGLILLTDDGELANALTHPSRHVEKRYEVTVRGGAPDAALDAMRGGMRLAEGERLAPVRVRARPAGIGGAGATVLEMVLGQGVNRQIRRMCRDLGLTILRLKRVGQGALELGDLKPGACRELTPTELAALRHAAEPAARPPRQ